MPLYGHDLDPAIDPVEGDLAFAISKRRREEGGFPGAARILGHLADGSPRKRVGLLVDGKLPVREGAKLFDGNTEIGVVTSGGFAPSVGAPIAMGYVPTRPVRTRHRDRRRSARQAGGLHRRRHALCSA